MRLSEDLQDRLIRKYLYIVNESLTPSKLKDGDLDFYKLSGVSDKEKREAEIDYYGQVILEFIMHPDISIDVDYKRMLNEVEEPNFVSSVIERLKNTYCLKGWQFIVSDLANGNKGIEAEYKKPGAKNKSTDIRTLNIMCPIINKNREIIINLLKEEGYYLTQECNIVDNDNQSDVKWLLLSFAPSNTKTVTGDVYKMNWLFHLTDAHNVAGILSDGLKVKSSDLQFKFPDRVYVWSETSIDDMLNLAKIRSKDDSSKHFAVIKIDVDKLPDNIEFYSDPLQNRAIYINESIDKSALGLFGFINTEWEPYIISTEEMNNQMSVIFEVIQPYVSKRQVKYNNETFVLGCKNINVANEIRDKLLERNISVSRIYNEGEYDIYMVVLPEMKTPS